MPRSSLGAYCFGSAFLGIAYWDPMFHLITAAILLNVLVKKEASRLAEPRSGL
jgi:hypothetical protein